MNKSISIYIYIYIYTHVNIFCPIQAKDDAGNEKCVVS